MKKLTIDDIRKLPGILGANEWRDRIYINVRGNGGSFAGERNSKVWMDASGKLNVERGRGMTSREWDGNLEAFRAAHAAAIEG